jgi:hypothetical protein
MLLGYQCNDSALDVCNRGGLNAEWIGSSYSNASSYRTDYLDDNLDEEDENGEEVIKECS